MCFKILIRQAIKPTLTETDQMTNSIKAQFEIKCADKSDDFLISSYTIVRLIKNQTTDQLLAMVALGEIIEDRIGEDKFEKVMIDIDNLKFKKVA